MAGEWHTSFGELWRCVANDSDRAGGGERTCGEVVCGTETDVATTGVTGEMSTEIGSGAGGGAEATGVGAGTCTGAGGATILLPVMIAPFSRLTKFNGAVLPAKNSAAVRDGSEEGTGGYISAWKESALERNGGQIITSRYLDAYSNKSGLTFLGTMNAIVSTAVPVTLYARPISHSDTSTARLGRKHIPR